MSMRQLCARDGLRLYKTPSCGVGPDFPLCFDGGTGEPRAALGRIRRAAD